MTSTIFLNVCVVAAVFTGLIAGIFLAFSDFIMKALKEATPAGGMEAMQVINRKVYGSLFLNLLFANTVLVIAIASNTLIFGRGPATVWIVAGAAIYIVGVMLVTVICNVPMNKQLDALDFNAEDGIAYWRGYQVRWTWWNHLRALASVVSTLCLIIGCFRFVPV